MVLRSSRLQSTVKSSKITFWPFNSWPETPRETSSEPFEKLGTRSVNQKVYSCPFRPKKLGKRLYYCYVKRNKWYRTGTTSRRMGISNYQAILFIAFEPAKSDIIKDKISFFKEISRFFIYFYGKNENLPSRSRLERGCTSFPPCVWGRALPGRRCWPAAPAHPGYQSTP